MVTAHRKADVYNDSGNTIEKVNLGTELQKEVIAIREKSIQKFANLNETINFMQVFRLNLYNAIKVMKNIGTKDYQEENPGLDTSKMSYLKEEVSSSRVGIVSFGLVLFGLLF